MSEVIPSFFNKTDFWAMLLPGYLTIFLGIILFYPEFLTSMGTDANGNISVDIFSVVIFIIAGPSIGFILWQICWHISSFVRFDKDSHNRKYEFERIYSLLRMKCADTERSELDSLDSHYKFGMTTANGIGIIALHSVFIVTILPVIDHGHCNGFLVSSNSILCPKNEVPSNSNDLDGSNLKAFERHVLALAIILVALILFLGSYLYNNRVRTVIICNLMNKHDLPKTMTCKRREDAIESRDIRKAVELISKEERIDKEELDFKGNVHKYTEHLVKNGMFDRYSAYNLILKIIGDKD